MFPKLWCVKVQIQKKEDSHVSMVAVAKNGPPPKFFKELLNIADGCCYKSCEDWWHEYELYMKDSQKRSSHSDTSQLIFKTNQLAGFCMDDKTFRQR